MPRVKQFDESAVLEKAMHLFWKQGYYATSVQDLVNHLGINRASIYDTFGDKKQLFDLALDHYRTTNTAFIRAYLASFDDVRMGLRAFYLKGIEDSRDDDDTRGCFVLNTTAEMVPNDEGVRNCLQNNQVNFEAIFADYLQTGVEKGQIRPEVDLKNFVTLYVLAFNGMKITTKVAVPEEALTSSLDSLLSLLD